MNFDTSSKSKRAVDFLFKFNNHNLQRTTFISKFDNHRNITMAASKEIISEYLEANPAFKIAKNTSESEPLDFQVDSDSEIYILQCPKSVNPKELKGAKMNFATGRFSLADSSATENHHQLECNVNTYESDKFVSFISPENQMQNIHTTGIIRISEKLPAIVEVKKESIKEESEPIPLPSNLKERHPFFGVNYKQRIKLKHHVRDLLDEAQTGVQCHLPAMQDKVVEKRKRKHELTFEQIDDGEVLKIRKYEKRSPKKDKNLKREQEEENELAWINTI
jgi:hypothetical protein